MSAKVDRARILEMLRRGYPTADIAKKCGVSASTVWRIAHVNGIEIRKANVMFDNPELVKFCLNCNHGVCYGICDDYRNEVKRIGKQKLKRT